MIDKKEKNLMHLVFTFYAYTWLRYVKKIDN